ncbi:MAG: hypothetical protein IT353_11710 [Gemmatimonadaceae bacterium]|nr:hypothetical protein [Gemmatimonadaceae bacterium]
MATLKELLQLLAGLAFFPGVFGIGYLRIVSERSAHSLSLGEAEYVLGFYAVLATIVHLVALLPAASRWKQAPVIRRAVGSFSAGAATAMLVYLIALVWERRGAFGINQFHLSLAMSVAVMTWLCVAAVAPRSD